MPTSATTPITLQIAVAPCSLGLVLVARGGAGLVAALLGDDAVALRDDLAARYPDAPLVDGDATTRALAARSPGAPVGGGGATPGAPAARAPAVVGRRADAFEEPLALRGTSFQRRVWQALREIRGGTTPTYGELARRIGTPDAVRAVGTA